jgi:MFS family permease
MTLVSTILAAQFLIRDPSQKGLSPYGEAATDGVGLKEEGFSLGKAVYFQQFWQLWVVFFCFGLIRSAIYIHIAPYTTDLGFSLIVGASVVAIISGGSSAGGLMLGRIGDSFGNRRTVMISFILIAVTLFWVVFSRQIWMLYLFAVLFGLGWGAIATLRISVTGELFGLRSLGVILGIVELGSKTGGAVGPLISGWIFDITDSYFVAFLFVAGIAIVGLLSSWQLKPISRKSVGVNTDE